MTKEIMNENYDDTLNKDYIGSTGYWNQASLKLSQQGQAYVLVTIIGLSGSTPRNSGAKMVVSKTDIYDTIGGGHLEYKAIKHAKNLLINNNDCQQIEHFELGSQLGQCCGGTVSLLFECFSESNIHIAVFGAGHVGKALIPMLAALPCRVTWIDNRSEQFPNNSRKYNNVSYLMSDDPASEVSSMPSNTLYVVMTHNHQLDFDITTKVLTREDFHYLGLIASEIKWRRFQQRYKHREIPSSAVARMDCPIGLKQIVGKLPMEVAISIAGKIINVYQSLLSDFNVGNKGAKWQDIKALIQEEQQRVAIKVEQHSLIENEAQQ